MPNEQDAQDTGTTSGQELSSNVGTEQAQQQTGAGEKVFTQAEVNAFLAKEKTGLKKQLEQELKTKQEQDRAKEQGEYQKLYEAEATKVAQLQKQLEDLQLELVRGRIAAKHKLTEAQAKRLQGRDETELENDAKELIKAFGINQQQEQPGTQHEGTPEGSRESRSRANAVAQHMEILRADPSYGM